MSPDDDFAGFAPPPFRPDEALVALKRSLRDLKLVERSAGFEWKGLRALELAVEEGAIAARVARRLMRSGTPEWDRYAVKSGAEQRKLIDEVKRRLDRWTREDD
jgi:hypothetical protein